MNGVDLIAAERRRQIEIEKWTPEHDDAHIDESLATVASIYATPPVDRETPSGELCCCGHNRSDHTEHGCDWAGCDCGHFTGRLMVGGLPINWPLEWDSSWWKPSPGDRIRELVKAGALIAAEIDRLQRLAKKLPAPPAKREVE